MEKLVVMLRMKYYRDRTHIILGLLTYCEESKAAQQSEMAEITLLIWPSNLSRTTIMIIQT